MGSRWGWRQPNLSSSVVSNVHGIVDFTPFTDRMMRREVWGRVLQGSEWVREWVRQGSEWVREWVRQGSEWCSGVNKGVSDGRSKRGRREWAREGVRECDRELVRQAVRKGTSKAVSVWVKDRGSKKQWVRQGSMRLGVSEAGSEGGGE